MPRISINQTNFTQGQISKHFAGRYDSEEYLEGALELTNVIVRPEGGAVRRPGTKLVQNYDDYARAIGFQITAGTAAKLIFEPDGNVQIIDPTGSYTVASGITGAAVHEFDNAKVRSSLIIVHRSFAPKELKRTFNISTSLWEWSIANWVFKDGPWEELNLDPSKKLKPRSATSPVFTSGDNGFTGEGFLEVVNKAGNANNWIGTSGALFDAFVAGRKIRFRQFNTSPAEEKWANLTIVSKTTSEVRVTVNNEYPILKIGAAAESKNWRLDAWYANNYPDRVALHQDRLWFFRDGWSWATMGSNLDTFSPSIPSLNDDTYQVTNDSGIAVEGINPTTTTTQWAVSYQALHVGLDGGGQIIQGQSTYSGITPSTVSIARQHGLPCSNVKPVLANYLYFVDSSRQKLYRLEYQYLYNAFLPKEITENDRDILFPGVRDMTFVAFPWKMIWATLEDGTIAVCTIDDEEKVFAWSKIVLANNYKARYIFAVNEDYDFPSKPTIYVLTEESLLLSFGDITVRKGVSTSRLTNTNSPPYFTSTSYKPREYVVDLALDANAGSPYNLSSLTSTYCLVDKTTYANYLTKSETITPANDYQVGASFYASMRLKPVDYIQSQTSNKKDLKSFQRIFFNLVDSGEFQIAEENTIVEGALVWKDVKFWDANSNVTTPPALFTGEKEIDYGSTQTFKPTLLIKQTKNVPFQVNSVSYDININEIK